MAFVETVNRIDAFLWGGPLAFLILSLGIYLSFKLDFLQITKLKEAFGENYIAEVDKKHYVWADDAGERVQIAISLTCPKNFIIKRRKTALPPIRRRKSSYGI